MGQEITVVVHFELVATSTLMVQDVVFGNPFHVFHENLEPHILHGWIGVVFLCENKVKCIKI